MQKKSELVRIEEQNDWVIFLIIGSIFLYIFMLISLKRDSNVGEFLRQKFPDSMNNFLSWVIIGFVFCLMLSALISPFIPLVPSKILDLQVFGFELNKFGFTFGTILLFYLLKNLLSYLYFAGTGSLRKWELFYFTSAKFYFCASLVLMILCIINNFYNVDQNQAIPIYFGVLLFLFSFKLLYYLFHKNNMLPSKWYYKFLYICTLQIVPVLVLWRTLFF